MTLTASDKAALAAMTSGQLEAIVALDERRIAHARTRVEGRPTSTKLDEALSVLQSEAETARAILEERGERAALERLVTEPVPRTMTPREFRLARARLRLTTRQLAAIMAVDVRTVRRWESDEDRSGSRAPSPIAVRVMEWLAGGWRPPEWPARPGAPERVWSDEAAS